MERALRVRRNVFLLALAIVVAMVAVSSVTAPAPEQAGRPDTLTVAFVVLALLDIAVWWAVLLRPDRVRELADRQAETMGLERMALVLSIMGVGGVTLPAVGGVILFQISGQVWRMATLLGVAVLGGALLWLRVGEDIRELVDRGMTTWDPFAGPGG